jgi:hypothetical protein
MAIGINRVIWVEAIRLRRSAVWWAPHIAACVVSVIFGAVFLFVLRDSSEPLAISVIGPNGWRSFAARLALLAVAAGAVAFVLIAMWLFARESVRRLEPLASRWTVAAAIVVVTLRWSLLVVVEIVALVLAFDALIFWGYLTPLGSDRTNWVP